MSERNPATADARTGDKAQPSVMKKRNRRKNPSGKHSVDGAGTTAGDAGGHHGSSLEGYSILKKRKGNDGETVEEGKEELPDEVYWEIKKEIDEIAWNFEIYYRYIQKVVHESAWDKFWKYLHQPLCVSFRLCSIANRHQEVENATKEISSHLNDVSWIEATGRKIPAPVVIKFGLKDREIISNKSHSGTLDRSNSSSNNWNSSSWNSGANAGWNNSSSTSSPNTSTTTSDLLAYQMCYDTKTLTRFFPEVQKWLAKHQRDTGIIQRQEIVSMFPVYLLNVQGSHAVLDMCASPGSKTTQALERVVDYNKADRGFVIANELDSKRAYVLSRRVQLQGNPIVQQGSEKQGVSSSSTGPSTGSLPSSSNSCLSTACIAITKHRAQIFPDGIYFDRIICDVPCSGDGTMRKYEDKWRSWTPFVGQQLHSLQLQILMRGLRLLKVGGLICYSTCSLNPLENEAVVQAAMSKLGDAFEVIDVHGFSDLPFRIAKGITDWRVVCKKADLSVNAREAHKQSQKSPEKSTSSAGNTTTNDAEKGKGSKGFVKNGKTPESELNIHEDAPYVTLDSFSDVAKKVENPQHRKRFRDSMWPQYTEDPKIKQDLKKCARLLPHYANTGAFFCCLIRKKKAWPANQDLKTQNTRRKFKTFFNEPESTSTSSGTKENSKVSKEGMPSDILLCTKTGSTSGELFAVSKGLHSELSKPNALNVLFGGARMELHGSRHARI